MEVRAHWGRGAGVRARRARQPHVRPDARSRRGRPARVPVSYPQRASSSTRSLTPASLYPTASGSTTTAHRFLLARASSSPPSASAAASGDATYASKPANFSSRPAAAAAAGASAILLPLLLLLGVAAHCAVRAARALAVLADEDDDGGRAVGRPGAPWRASAPPSCAVMLRVCSAREVRAERDDADRRRPGGQPASREGSADSAGETAAGRAGTNAAKPTERASE